MSKTAVSRSLVDECYDPGRTFGLAPTTINPKFKDPYVQSWNLNVEQQITPTLGLTLAYVGSKGTHLRIARNMNFGNPNLTIPTPTATNPNPSSSFGRSTATRFPTGDFGASRQIQFALKLQFLNERNSQFSREYSF